MSSRQRKSGILINYAMLLSSTIISISLTPFIISSLGVNDYGLYQTISGLASNLLIIDLGTGTLMTRFLSVYISKNDERGKENFVAIGLIFSAVCALVIILLGITVCHNIPLLYSDSLTLNEVAKAQAIFIFMIANLAISTFDKSIFGIVNAYEKHTISKGILLVKVLSKAVLIFILLSLGGNIVTLVSIDLFLSIVIMGFMVTYVFGVLKIKVHFHYIEKSLFVSASTFIAATFFQTVVTQVNQSVDKVLLGVMIDTTTVTIYSVGIVIITSYNMIAHAIGGIYLPHVTKRIHAGASNREITNLTIQPGRINFIFCGLIALVFALYGYDFIKIWVGTGYEQAYYVALMLILCYLIPHMETIMGSVLDAKNKRLSRSIIIFVIAVMNIALTILLIPRYGIIGATVGTVVALILGHWIIINIYYLMLGIEVKRMFVEIIHGTLPCLLMTGVISSPLLFIRTNRLSTFLMKCIFSVVVFAILEIKFGINENERKILGKLVNRIKKSADCDKSD